jgi:patatin-like phospholipase/acyl hydrolase
MTRSLRILSLGILFASGISYQDSDLVLTDGGGIRGVSALLILESIMEKIPHDENLGRTPLPYEYFDIIGGTSTGG